MRLFLLGYMGAGKTTLGVLLAKEKGVQFIDLDAYIESRYQKTIGTIFQEKGEKEFRRIENLVLKEVADIEDVIISAGGGTPCHHNNMEVMKEKGTTIYLKASPDVLASRLSTCKDKRPLIKDKSENELSEFIAQTLKQREMYYNQADIIFDANNFENEDQAREIVRQLISVIE